jgi:hypothetical protein
MTISSYLTAFLQSPSNAYEIAIRRCASDVAAGVAALSIAFWNAALASLLLPS